MSKLHYRGTKMGIKVCYISVKQIEARATIRVFNKLHPILPMVNF